MKRESDGFAEKSTEDPGRCDTYRGESDGVRGNGRVGGGVHFSIKIRGK